MVFRKRRFKRKRFGGRRPRRSMPRRMRRRMRPRYNPEVKTHSIAASSVDIPSVTGAVQILTNISQSLTAFGRSGNKIQPVRLQVNMCFNNLSTESCIKWAIVRQLPSLNDTPFDIAEIWGVTAGALSLRDPLFLRRYKFIKSGRLTMNTFAVDQNSKKFVSINIALRSPVHYIQNGADQASAGRGQLFLIAISDVPAASTEPRFSFETRLYYIDN